MTTRRNFLKTGPAAVLGLTGLTLDANAVVAPSITASEISMSHSFPNTEVIAHTGEKLRFYDDLIKDKVVMINFMSIGNEAKFPVTARLVKVADLLADRLGRDIHMISVTREPSRDTQIDLLNFAEKFAIRSGWTFVRADIPVLKALENRIYHHGAVGSNAEMPPDSTNLVHSISHTVDIVLYGNSQAGLWGTFPIEINAEDAARRVSWVVPKSATQTSKMRRAGPREISAAGFSSDNRQV